MEGGGAPELVPNRADLLKQNLVDEFRPVLDEALILALVLERDIVANYDAIRQILLTLAASAQEEATMGFDPSGLGSPDDFQSPRLDEHVSTTCGNATAMSAPESWVTTDRSTTLSSEAADPALLLDVEPDDIRFTEQTNLTEQEKIEELMVIFPNFKDHTIRFILKQDEGDLEKAFDTLLTRQYLDESGELTKGIDGFFKSEDEGEWHLVHKGKAKAPPHANQGRRVPLPVSYKMPPSASNGDGTEASDDMVNPKLPGHSPGAWAWASPSSLSVSAVTTVRLRAPVPARHLKMFSEPSSSTTSSSPWQTVERKKRKKAAASSASAPPLDKHSSFVSSNNDLPTSSHLLRAASALGRKGPLGRQAAAVYAERARAEAPAQSLEAAQLLVDAQSSPRRIDLHGVTVVDGVRIAKARTRAWWEGLPDEAREGEGGGRNRAARLDGFTVVTGVGNHSAVHGVSRLRQAVGAALRNDGWRIETLTGEFYVWGRV